MKVENHNITLGAICLCVILLILCLLLWAVPTQAQTKPKTSIPDNVRVDSAGNYIALFPMRVKGIDMPTGKTYMDTKGIKYDVWKTSTGRFVYYRTSKNTGKLYKVYLSIPK